MFKSIQLCLLLLLLIATVIPAAAKTVTLAWDPSPSAGVDNYKVYYRTDTPTFPFNGTNLSQGVSPIVVDGSTTSLDIDLPEDGTIYYFTTTAATNTGIESTYSNIIASEWVPTLITPTDNAAIRPDVVTFMWDRPPSDFNVSFELLYGTDPNFSSSAIAVIKPGKFGSNWPQFTLNMTSALALLLSLLILIISSGRAKRHWKPVRVGFCIGVLVLQASCGGSGGSGGGGDEIGTAPGTSVPSASVPATVTPSSLFTNSVNDIYETEYQATDLQPNTQYYWKVVAVDNWGKPYESIPQKFTTLSE